MILYNNSFKRYTSKDTEQSRFEFDYVFMDIYHNINFIKYKNEKRLKTRIKDIFDIFTIRHINDLNKFLEDYNLITTYITNDRHLYFYEIISTREYEKEHNFKIKVPVDAENRFNDLD